MYIYAKCVRNSAPSYTRYDGLDEATITSLLTELGATDIEFLDEETFTTELMAALAAQ